MEDELRQIHGEDGFEEADLKFDDLKFDQDPYSHVTPNEENKTMQEAGAANHISGREEKDLFTYEVCPLNFSHFFL
jgi:hypothetical protein